MRDQTLTLSTADGEMALYEAVPSGEARGAVVVLQEAFGVNTHIEDVTRRLAKESYHAVAPHLFHRTGGGTVPYDQMSEVLKHMAELSDGGILADFDAAASHLHEAGWQHSSIGVVGFCMGGRASFLVSAKRHLGAGVGFYGGGIVKARSERMPALTDLISQMHTPWLGLFGDTDQSIPVEDVESLREALAAKTKVPYGIVRYAGAGHGFHCDARDAYDRAAATDAWKRTLDWFGTHLA